jgi:hypothetical protein
MPCARDLRPCFASRHGRGLASTLRCPDDGFDRPTWSLLPLHATDFEHRSRLSSDALFEQASGFNPVGRWQTRIGRERFASLAKAQAARCRRGAARVAGRGRSRSGRSRWRLHSAHHERADQAKIKTSREFSATRHRASCVKRKVRRANSLPRSVKFPVMCVVLMVPEEVFEPPIGFGRARWRWVGV